MKKILPVVILIVAFLGYRLFSYSEGDVEHKVVAINDGDTLEMIQNGKKIRVRLAYIDSPEKGQAFGNKSRQYLADLCFGKIVQLQHEGLDQYKRILGIVYLEDGTNINKEMIKAGMAWCYTQYAKDSTYAQLQHDAQKKKIGLWVDKHAVAPWEYRKLKRTQLHRK